MKVLFIGGTGNISTAVSRLAVESGIDLTVLNRGKTPVQIDGVSVLHGDISREAEMETLLQGLHFDSVVNWIAFSPEDVKRDIRLFSGKCGQYIFISSASCYQKPVTDPVITESTPLANPWWEYSRNKIACEELCLAEYRKNGFPATIVRPSYTYDTVIPVAMGGFREYTTVNRIKQGKPIIVHGDGTSLWTNTHAADFAEGFVGLLGNPRTVAQAYHITSDEILTWDQIYNAVGAAVGVEPKIVHVASDLICSIAPRFTGDLLGDKAHSVIFDNSKIKRIVPEFNAVIPFHLGIRDTISWFEEKPERMVVNPETDALFEKILSAVPNR